SGSWLLRVVQPEGRPWGVPSPGRLRRCRGPGGARTMTMVACPLAVDARDRARAKRLLLRRPPLQRVQDDVEPFVELGREGIGSRAGEVPHELGEVGMPG